MAGAIVGSLLGGAFLSVGIFFLYKWNRNKQKQKTIHKNYNKYSQEEKEIPTKRDIHNHEQTIDNNEQEITQINDNTTNYESSNDSYGQEIIQINDNTTVNYELTKDHHGQEMPKNGQTALVNNNYNDERLSLQAFKDEMLQAVKQENQNLRNEILQIVKENYNNTKNNSG
jgi:hypothetical protein